MAAKRLKPRSLSLAFYNADGLNNQRPQIHDLLNRDQIDVMLVQETFLKPSMRDPRIANYNLARNDRVTAPKGGTLIYYRRSLHCMPLDPPSLVNMEASVCRIAMTGHQPIILASVYLPPDKQLLRSDIESLLDLGSAVILAGDFNCKHESWNCRSSNRNGRILESLVDSLSFDIISPIDPTHYPYNVNHSPDILDMALLKGVTLPLRSIAVLHELDSDHRPVVLQLGSPTDTLPQTRTVVDWPKLEESLKGISSPHLDRIPDDVVSSDDVDISIEALTNHLHSAIGESSSVVPAANDRRWQLPEDVRELLRAKNASIRAYDNYPTETNRVRMRALQRDVKQRISELRDRHWDHLLEEISPSHQAYWKLARTLKTDSTLTMPPLIRPQQPPAFDDEEKAEYLAETLESQCSLSTDPVDPVHLDMVNSEVERRAVLPPSDSLPPVKASEVQTIIHNLKVRKAPGADGISNNVLKRFSVPLIYLLVSIFNAAMANCSFPNAWKQAVVIGIHKPGKPYSDPTSYRPISLLSSLGKIYERLLLSRLREVTMANNLLPNEQFGFRAKHSCVQQVLRITEHIHHNLSQPKPAGTGALFFDVAKAFDKVWHNGLLYKLFTLGVPDRLVLILRDFLTNRSFRYRVEGTLSSPHPIAAGVPQGSALSPLLFSLYTSDIPRHRKVELALFADDTALYTSDRNKRRIVILLQAAANALGDWFRKWRIEVNPGKSAAMYFCKSHIKIPLNKITLFNRPIPWERSVKYLGVTLDRTLNFRAHVKRVRDRAAFILGRLHPLLGKRSKMALRNKVTIYKTCIRPIMTYAGVVFAHAPSSTLHKLQVIQNRFMRKAVGAPWFLRNVELHTDFELPTIAQYLKLSSRRFFDAAPHHPNPLVVKAADYGQANLSPPRRRRPRHVLDDPDDLITAAIAAMMPSSTSDTRNTTHLHRPRRRGRGRPASAYTRYTHVPGRFSPAPQALAAP